MPLPESPPTGKLPFEPPTQSPLDLHEFWHLWRAEKFWACHEALEDVWKIESDATRKRFLQGLIHGAVAVFQYRRGNFVGASRQWVRCQLRLEASLPLREGLNITQFLAGIENEIAPSFLCLNSKQNADLLELETRLRMLFEQ